jgi:hypothetical protein
MKHIGRASVDILFHTVLAEVSEQEADWQSFHACRTCSIWQNSSEDFVSLAVLQGRNCYILAEIQ